MRVCCLCVVQQTSRGFEERFAMWSTNLWVSRTYLAFFNVSLFRVLLLFSLLLDCYCCVVAAACCACCNGHRVPVWVSHCVYSQTFLWTLLFLFMCAYKGRGKKSFYSVLKHTATSSVWLTVKDPKNWCFEAKTSRCFEFM